MRPSSAGKPICARQQHAEEHRHHFTDVRRQEIAKKLPNVGENRAAFRNRGDDRCEVVVCQHHVCGLLGHVRSRDAHGDADVGLLQRRSVVHAISGHGHDRACTPQRVDDAQFVFRVDACVDRHLGRRARTRPPRSASRAPPL